MNARLSTAVLVPLRVCSTVLACSTVLICSTVLAEPFSGGDAVEGEKSYVQYKCQSCHIEQFGGDGSAIFTRKERRIRNATSLATQIRKCATNLGLMMFEDEEENLGAFLNKRYYKFK